MKYLREFENHSQYETFTGTSEFILPNVSTCIQENDVHYNPFVVDPCASEKVKTTYEWVDLGLPSGKKWANKNIGALTVTDYGQYFAWGEVQGFTADQVSGGCKAFSWSDYKYCDGTNSNMTKYNASDGKTVLEVSDDTAVANMGGSWHMPTETDFNELLNTSNCTKEWVTNYNGSGIKGRLFTSKTNGNTLFFPAAGYCHDGSVTDINLVGYYWSSSLNTSTVVYGRILGFDGLDCSISNGQRRHGFAVRGVVG